MDINLILDVLNKHQITNVALAEDLQMLAKQCYLDGAFDCVDNENSPWWEAQDQDSEWVEQFELGKEIIKEDKEVLSALDVKESQQKQIENGDLKEPINEFIEEYEAFENLLEDSSPPSQEDIEAYEKLKQANIKFDLDKPLDDEDEE